MKKIAICLGVDHYASPDFSNNCGAEPDAMAMREMFNSDLAFNFVALLPGDGTAEDVLSYIRSTRANLGDGDLLVFYFAGHGRVFDSEQHILLRDFRAKDLEISGAIRLNALCEAMDGEQIQALIAFDCCRSEIGSEMWPMPVSEDVGKAKPRDLIVKPAPCRNVTVLYACKKHGKALEWPERRGHFTHALLKHIEQRRVLNQEIRIDAHFIDKVTKRMRMEIGNRPDVHPASDEARQTPDLISRGSPLTLWSPSTSADGVWLAVIVVILVLAVAILSVQHLVGKTAIEASPIKPTDWGTARNNVGESKLESRRFRDPMRGGGQGPWMIVIPEGEFWMGAPNTEPGGNGSEKPRQKVRVESFASGVFEVTFDEYWDCVIVGACTRTPANPKAWPTMGLPVFNVDWNGAQQYVRWLQEQTGQNYRLLSEAEWEYAARAHSRTAFYFGNFPSPALATYNAAAPYEGLGNGSRARMPSKVGAHPPNAFGLYDMHGNLYEWVQDCWHDDYWERPLNGSPWESGGDCGRRVIRGGSWFSGPYEMRAAARRGESRHRKSLAVGFRVARDVSADEIRLHH